MRFVLIFLKSGIVREVVEESPGSGGYRGAAVITEPRALSEAKVNVPSLIIVDLRADSVAKS